MTAAPQSETTGPLHFRPTTNGGATPKGDTITVPAPPEARAVPVGDRGHVALVDAADYDLVAAHRWRLLTPRTGGPYAACSIGGRTVMLHRLLLDEPPGLDVDHRNGIGLDNRRANLRAATRSENGANQGPRPGSSSFKGVSRARGGRWQASIKVGGRSRALGYFADEESAARAYDRAARATWGEFARCNFEVSS
jgi:hypothetical protein